MIQDFIINVTKPSGGVTQKGFGTVLVLSDEVDMDYTTFSSAEEVKIETSTETFKIVNAIFSQSSDIEVAVIGKKDAEQGLPGLLEEAIEEGHDFYGVVSTADNIATIKQIADRISSLEKMYFATVYDGDVENTIQSENVVLAAHSDKDKKVGEALAGVMLSRNIGGMTAKFKTLNGISPSGFDTDVTKALMNKDINIYTRRRGVNYLTEGVTTSGEFVDVTLGKHYIKFRLEEDLLQHFTNVDNVDFTNQGIGEVINVVELRMADTVEQGIFESYEIGFANKEEIPVAELANRRYNYIRVTGTLAGAIHGAKVNVYMVF